MFDDLDYFRCLGGPFIDNKVGVLDRHASVSNTESFQSRFLDEAACGVSFRIFKYLTRVGQRQRLLVFAAGQVAVDGVLDFHVLAFF